MRDWIDRLGADRVPRLSVNLSRADIYRADLCSYLNDLLRRYNLPTDLLHLEITETAYMEAPEQLVDAVTKLRAAGFVVEMDDFGSGYSSLNTLKDVPVDALKIDMGFLDARDRTRGGIILASVVRMARLLDLPATAEGVETQEQAVYLASIGCEYMQGYLFSKPLDRASFERLLTCLLYTSLAARSRRSPPLLSRLRRAGSGCHHRVARRKMGRLRDKARRQQGGRGCRSAQPLAREGGRESRCPQPPARVHGGDRRSRGIRPLRCRIRRLRNPTYRPGRVKV